MAEYTNKNKKVGSSSQDPRLVNYMKKGSDEPYTFKTQ